MEKTLINVCNLLPRDYFETTMAVLVTGCAMESRLDCSRTDLIHIPKKFGNDPRVPLLLARELRKRKIDILHTNMWGTLLEGALAAKIARTSVVIHEEHGTVSEKKRHLHVQRWAWRDAARVVSVSPALADRMHKVVGYPRKDIHVINNSVDTDRFFPLKNPKTQLRTEFCLPQGVFTLAMVSRFVPFKNHAGVIRAIASLKSVRSEVHLALVGDGPLADDLRQLTCDLEVADRVHFLGETDQVERVLNACDAFVSNSTSNEGLSLAILEGMACGMPAIATDVAAHSEVLDGGNAGVLIPPNDPEALVVAIQRLAGAPGECARLGDAGRNRVKSKYGLPAMVDAYAEMYLDLAPRTCIPAC